MNHKDQYTYPEKKDQQQSVKILYLVHDRFSLERQAFYSVDNKAQDINTDSHLDELHCKLLRKGFE